MPPGSVTAPVALGWQSVRRDGHAFGSHPLGASHALLASPLAPLVACCSRSSRASTLPWCRVQALTHGGAGTFRALRIPRTSRLRIDNAGTFLDRVNVIWYAPDLGHEVRQVLGETSVELLEWRSAAVGG